MGLIYAGMSGSQFIDALNTNLPQTANPDDVATYYSAGKMTNPFNAEGLATLYARSGRGTITNMFFCGATGSWVGYQDAVLTVITDGQTYFSGKLYELAAMGMSLGVTYENTKIFNSLFSKNGINNAINFNYQIPYYTSVSITLQQPAGHFDDSVIWYSIKSTDSVNIVINGFRIPEGAYLRAVRKSDDVVAKGAQFELLNTDNDGLLLGIYLFASGGVSNNYLEGCIRAYIGDATIPNLVSSGLEDYFISTYYFDTGTFAEECAGTPLLDLEGYKLSAYSLYHKDILPFVSGGYKLTVRNGDQQSSDDIDLDDAETIHGIVGNTTFGAQVLTYEW